MPGNNEADGSKIPGSRTTIGMMELGAGVVLSKDALRNFKGAFGVTDDLRPICLQTKAAAKSGRRNLSISRLSKPNYQLPLPP
jgi:hypothetical protein